MLPKILAVVADWRGANDASYAYAFKEIGCNVKIIDVNKAFKNCHFIEKVYRKIFMAPFKQKIDEFNRNIMENIDTFKPNLLFIAKGLWLKKETIEYAKSKNITTVHWHPDDAFNPENSSTILDSCINIYDLIVTPKSFNVDEYKLNGANQVLYLPYCYDPNIHYPVKLNGVDRQIYGSGLTFVGAMRKKRVSELQYLYDNNLDMKVWGTGWNKLSSKYSFKNICMFKPVYAEDMSKVFQSSLIVLGFLNEENRDLHTARTFEVPACKGFLMAERTDEHKEFFREGIEADFFSDLNELIEKSKFYLDNVDKAKIIAENGYNKVISMNATYVNRASQILDYLNFK